MATGEATASKQEAKVESPSDSDYDISSLENLSEEKPVHSSPDVSVIQEVPPPQGTASPQGTAPPPKPLPIEIKGP